MRVLERVNELHKIIEGKYTDNIPARLLIVLCGYSKTAYEIFTELVNVKLAEKNHEAILSLSFWDMYCLAEIPDDFTPLARVNLNDNAPIIVAMHKDCGYMFLQDSSDMAGEAPVIELTTLDVRDLFAKAEAHDDFIHIFSDILAYRFPYWLPVEKFCAGMENILARGRIIVMARNCTRTLSEIYAEYDERYYTSVLFFPWQCKIYSSPSWGYANGVDIALEYDEGGKNLAGISITLTMGDNASQTIELFSDATQNNMSWTFNKTLTLNDGTELNSMEIKPFVKISKTSDRLPAMYVHPSLEALGTDKAAIWEKFAWLNISWTSPNDWDHWSVLKDIKRKSIMREILGDEEMKKFEADFTKRFGEVYYLEASAGYEVSLRIPARKLEALDRDFDGHENSRDYVAEFVALIVTALREMTKNPNVGGKS